LNIENTKNNELNKEKDKLTQVNVDLNKELQATKAEVATLREQMSTVNQAFEILSKVSSKSKKT